MSDDASELDQLDDRHSGFTSPDEDESQVQADDQQADKDDSGGPEDANWKPLTVYLLDERHQEFNKPFFMELQLAHSELQQYMKRELQQAAIEVAMEYKEEVVERSKELHGEIQEAEDEREDDWEPLTVYLTEEQHQEFSKPFFMRLQLDYPELQSYMKREMQQAAIEVAMEHQDEVADQAREVHQRLL